jgi:tryptophanase
MKETFHTIIEPFRIKMVEPIPMLTRQERCLALEEADHNLFNVPARKVTIDLLTDSGTGAMSANQWSRMLVGDESYSGSTSFERFHTEIQKLTGFKFIYPVHQGRAAERILLSSLIQKGDTVLSNTLFDTTRGNVEFVGGMGVDIPVQQANEPNTLFPFKGNMDLLKLQAGLDDPEKKVKLVIMTVTNNAVGGQPVSMENISKASALCKERSVPFFLDAARFAENCWFIHTREKGYRDVKLYNIAQEMFGYADGFVFSGKKDAIVNIGGILATSLSSLEEPLRDMLILTEGFPTYGGLAGRDLEAMTTGVLEALNPEYLRYRMSTVEYLSQGLVNVGVPVVQPAGGHAVYIDAELMLPHIPVEQFPGVALANALYEIGGVRSVEIGRLMFPNGNMNLVRLALPRRVYTQAHIDYVIEVAQNLVQNKNKVIGLEIVEAPKSLRHFSAKLRPV